MPPFDCNHDGSCEKVRLCCVDTEMTLTKKDTERIERLGHTRDAFLIRSDDGFCELRNIEGHCYFYSPDTRLCNIYENRPDGCRYYPVIYDMKKRKCIVDKDCPSRETMTRGEIRKVCHKVKRLVETLMQEAEHSDGPC
ncbi:MAG: YkgJ family cysteine cluster protein [Candidatus Thorarchaeota archaeon]